MVRILDFLCILLRLMGIYVLARTINLNNLDYTKIIMLLRISTGAMNIIMILQRVVMANGSKKVSFMFSLSLVRQISDLATMLVI